MIGFIANERPVYTISTPIASPSVSSDETVSTVGLAPGDMNAWVLSKEGWYEGLTVPLSSIDLRKATWGRLDANLRRDINQSHLGWYLATSRAILP
jgi:hypothetical protein